MNVNIPILTKSLQDSGLNAFHLPDSGSDHAMDLILVVPTSMLPAFEKQDRANYDAIRIWPFNPNNQISNHLISDDVFQIEVRNINGDDRGGIFTSDQEMYQLYTDVLIALSKAGHGADDVVTCMDDFF